MIKSSEIIKRAMASIEPEGSWCRGAVARNASGAAVGASSQQACSFCIAGAVERACAPEGFALTPMDLPLNWIRLALKKRGQSYEVGEIAAWQDMPERTQIEAYALMNEARILATEAGD